jgi:hypothetical protein
MASNLSICIYVNKIVCIVGTRLWRSQIIVIGGAKSYKTLTIKQEEIYYKCTTLKVKIRHL